MLAIPLPRLEREGVLEILGELPPDHPGWKGTDLRFSTPISVSGRARWMSSGEVVVRVHLRGRLDQECRRCLAAVETKLELEVGLLFLPEGEIGEGDDEVRPLPETATELDLTEALREEVILSCSPLALCRPDCLGFCPRCGVNLNQERCQCSSEGPDPRWDALRALREERE
jgi:uncharacterized protein